MLIKKIITTLFIVLAIALAGVAICIGVMAIFPDVNIFGYYFVYESSDSKIVSINGANDMSTINNLEIESGTYDVEIVRDDSKSGVKYRLESQYAGLVRKNESDRLIKKTTVNASSSTGTAIIETVEPTGLVVAMKNKLTIYVGKSGVNEINLNNMKVNLDKAGFKVNVGNASKTFNVKNMELSKISASNKIDLSGIKISENLKATHNYGQLDLTNILTQNGSSYPNVEITTKIGTFTLGNVNNLTVTDGVTPYIHVKGNVVKEISYKSKSGTLIVDGTVGNNNGVYPMANIYSDASTLKFGTLISDLDIKSYNQEERSKSTNLTIETLGSNLDANKISIINMVNGALNIKKVYSKLIVASNDGDVTLGDEKTENCFVFNDICVETKSGRINALLNGAKHNINLFSTYGTITATNVNPANNTSFDYTSKIEELNSNNQLKYIQMELGNASKIQTDGNSTINISFVNMGDGIDVTANSKNVNINFATTYTGEDITYNLNSLSGEINVDLDFIKDNNEQFVVSSRNKTLTTKDGQVIKLLKDTSGNFSDENYENVTFGYKNSKMFCKNDENAKIKVTTNSGIINIKEI